MKIVSWNVNGIRACVKKGFFDFLESESPDVLFLQETKATVDDLEERVLRPSGYHSAWHSAEKRGYSGVAVFTKEKPENIVEGFGIEQFDREGRVISTDFGDFVVFGVYFPNGTMDGRLTYKLEFYEAFWQYVNDIKDQGKHVVICGDYNTAHCPIDLARPKENEGNSGFLPVEREWMDRIMDMGYVDTFRHFHPDTPDEYSWWSYRTAARKRNIGWRIDYVLVDAPFIDRVDRAFILQEVLGSDHCPVGIELG